MNLHQCLAGKRSQQADEREGALKEKVDLKENKVARFRGKVHFPLLVDIIVG